MFFFPWLSKTSEPGKWFLLWPVPSLSSVRPLRSTFSQEIQGISAVRWLGSKSSWSSNGTILLVLFQKDQKHRHTKPKHSSSRTLPAHHHCCVFVSFKHRYKTKKKNNKTQNQDPPRIAFFQVVHKVMYPAKKEKPTTCWVPKKTNRPAKSQILCGICVARRASCLGFIFSTRKPWKKTTRICRKQKPKKN